jgi:hypothetical protein
MKVFVEGVRGKHFFQKAVSPVFACHLFLLQPRPIFQSAGEREGVRVFQRTAYGDSICDAGDRNVGFLQFVPDI